MRRFFLFFFLALFQCVPFFKHSAALAVDNDSPQAGGAIVMATIGEPSNLIPYLASDSASHMVADLIFTAPLEYNEYYEIVPLAAESWSVEQDGRLLKFKLREDVFWQDGVQLTADDVAFTYGLMTDPKTPTAYAADFLNIKEFRQTGKFTFEAEYEKPFARSLITFMQPIMPKHLLENEDIVTTGFSRNPVGAGPFKLKDWSSGRTLLLEANDTYFKGRPYLDEILYRIIPDTSTIFMEARAGNIDLLDLTPQQYLLQTKGGDWEAKWKKYKYLASAYTYVGFNLKDPRFADKRVRKALSMAMDRGAIIKGALMGMGEKTVGPYKPGSWVYNDKLSDFPYDAAAASRLLNEAGWTAGSNGVLRKDDMELSFTVLVNQGNEERIKVATILQQFWKQIGVDISVRTVEWAAFINEFVNKGRFEALILGWNILDDPDLFDVWHSSSIKENGLNFVNYANAEVDDLLEQARVSVDREKRKALYDRMQEILYEDEPYLFLYVPYALPMVRSKYQGISPAPAGIAYNIDRWWIPQNLR